MKRTATYILTILVLSLTCIPRASAQGNETTSGVLESYAALCDSCLMLKKSLSEGNTISSDSARLIIGRFVETGKKLKSEYGSMPPWQKDIYRIITERFSNSSYTEPFYPKIPVLPAIRSERIAINDKSEIPDKRTNDIAAATEYKEMPAKPAKNLRFSIIASASFPYPTGGLMLSAQYKGWGGYVKGTSNFTRAASTYTCLSNGTLPDGSEFWGGGKNRLEIKSLTAGAMLPIIKNLSIYAGAGAGRWTLTWMDMDTSWAKVSDLSHSGIAAEAGLVAGWKFLAFSAGVTTIKFHTFQVNVGIGARF
ncbi:MAG: hypothetical protein ACI4UJ_09745 [Candidatus Cryptobacteroides sp.]